MKTFSDYLKESNEREFVQNTTERYIVALINYSNDQADKIKELEEEINTLKEKAILDGDEVKIGCSQQGTITNNLFC